MHTRHDPAIDWLRIERSGVPIYVQLRERILEAMAAGVLKPGERMPTMRQVAVALRIDINTVRRAYEAVEQLGALQLVHGRGTFVADPAAARPAEPPLTHATTLARQALAAAAAHGVDPADLAQRILELADRRPSS